jgi:hypothetical protein
VFSTHCQIPPPSADGLLGMTCKPSSHTNSRGVRFLVRSDRTIGPTLGLRWSPSDSGNRRPQKSGRGARLGRWARGARAGINAMGRVVPCPGPLGKTGPSPICDLAVGAVGILYACAVTREPASARGHYTTMSARPGPARSLPEQQPQHQTGKERHQQPPQQTTPQLRVKR